MEMTTLKSRCKMKNILTILLLSFLYLSCKKDNIYLDKIDKNTIKKDSLIKIKDTTLFVNSSEGENVIFKININTNDSIIESEVFGEMGKSEYRFIFNKNLKSGECKTYRYSEPIYVNSDPQIKSQHKENLSSSIEVSKRLINIFTSYRKVFFNHNKKIESNNINSKWYGKYSFSINENSDDWREIHEIKIDVSKDSIIYLAKGYQLYQYYTLFGIEKGNSLILKYDKSLDNTDSWALKKTKDFGIIMLNGNQYILNSPYIDINFSNGNRKKYLLKKQ